MPNAELGIFLLIGIIYTVYESEGRKKLKNDPFKK